jgi:hypothetical protein
MIKQPDAGRSPSQESVVVVLNSFEELKRLVPPN